MPREITWNRLRATELAGIVRVRPPIDRVPRRMPVLLSAMASKPDRLLTHNTKHFTNVVAQRTALRIATSAEFFRALSALS